MEIAVSVPFSVTVLVTLEADPTWHWEGLGRAERTELPISPTVNCEV